MKYLKLFETDRFSSKSVENELKMCFDGMDDLELKAHVGYGEKVGEFLVGITSQASDPSGVYSVEDTKGFFYVTDDIIDEIYSSCGKSEELGIKFISIYVIYLSGLRCTYKSIAASLHKEIACRGIIIKLKKDMPIDTYPW